MNTLAVALQALDPHQFEQLVVQLLQARYPTVDIKHVQGQSGDEGLDIISGKLDERPTVWQCKAFRNGVGESQKQQIRDSFNQALQHCTPRRWVLCLTVNFDAKVMRWWQKFAKSHANQTELDLWQANDFLQQLLTYQSIREAFFPETVLNVTAIRESLAGTKSFSLEELAAVTDQNAHVYLARLEALDPRFTYAITHSRNQPPPHAPPGTLATIVNDQNVIHVMPRDLQALKANPPRGQFTVQGTGVEKFAEHRRTGVPISLSADELRHVTSAFDYLLPKEFKPTSLQIKPVPSDDPIPLRLTFGSGKNAIIYDYVLLRKVRSGTDEALLETATPLPFPIEFFLRPRQLTGDIRFRDLSRGFKVEDVHRQARALIQAMTDGELDCFNLAAAKHFVRIKLALAVPDWLAGYERFLNLAATVATAYNVTLTIPESITEHDEKTLLMLKALLAGFALNDCSVTVEMEKQGHAELQTLSPTIPDSSMDLDGPEFPGELTVFGTRITTGPVHLHLPAARARDQEEYREFLLKAPIGSTIRLSFDAMKPATITRLPGRCVSIKMRHEA